MEDYIKSELNLNVLKRTEEQIEGCNCVGYVFETDNGSIFVKENSQDGADIMFDGEYNSLKSIIATHTVRAPKPLLRGKIQSQCFLAMEYLNITPLSTCSAQLGEALAKLHLHNINIKDSGNVGKSDIVHIDKFGYHSTTCCGFLPLNNDWCDDWVSFYTQQRLEPQISMLLRNTGDNTLVQLWSELQLKIPTFFKDCIVEPSLLHGDLWSGNTGQVENEGVIFDPGVFYGHHEFDLAIAVMWGNLDPTFYDSYHNIIPKQPRFEKRHYLYQLFHHLNHWNHFGDKYKSSTITIMNNLCYS